MILKKLGLSSDFNKNVVMLFTGTAIAQAIPVAISPILTRLYSPEEFGLFALFFSIANLLGVIATGRYELAIVLPKDEEDANRLEKLCYVISVLIGLVLLVIVLLLHDTIVTWLGNPDLDVWLYFVPLSVTLTGVIQTISYDLNRKKSFNNISYLKISQNTAYGFTSLLLGAIKVLKNGLIVGHILGQVTSIAFAGRQVLFKTSWKGLGKIAATYRNFALFNAPAALLNTAAASLPVLFMSKLLEKKDLGFYGLVERSIGAPISLVSYSISQVLLEDIASRYKQDLPIRPRILKLLMNLSLIGVIPFTLLFFYSEDIFTFVFGQQWAEAGRYASILSVAFFMRFVISPLSMVLISTNSLVVLVIWQALYFCTTLGVVIYSLNSQDIAQFLVLLVVNDVILYLIYLYLILNVAKK